MAVGSSRSDRSAGREFLAACCRVEEADDRLAPRSACVALTGYRPEKFRSVWPSGGAEDRVRRLARPAIKALYAEGGRRFLCGMAEGFDLWVAAEVLALRDTGVCPEAEIVAVVPFAGHGDRCGAAFRPLYAAVWGRASQRFLLSDGYTVDCFHRRNDFLVGHAGTLLCFYTGLRGGTAYTVSRAEREGLRVVNLAAPALPLFG